MYNIKAGKVINFFFFNCCQLCGRAGRGGGASRAHIFYNPEKKKVDKEVKDFCAGKENCRRDVMLRAIGSKVISDRELNSCCDVCSEVPSNVSFELLGGSVSQKRKRRVAVRVVDEDLEAELRARLLKEREQYLELHPSYKMIGADFVCPLDVINDLCSRARFIDCVYSWMKFRLTNRGSRNTICRQFGAAHGVHTSRLAQLESTVSLISRRLETVTSGKVQAELHALCSLHHVTNRNIDESFQLSFPMLFESSL